MKLNLETENASLNKNLTETREKYNKCRAHLEEIKTMLTKQNFKDIVKENIDLCNIRVKMVELFISHKLDLYIIFRMN
jgi:predicted nuclease with TOPRIM domain